MDAILDGGAWVLGKIMLKFYPISVEGAGGKSDRGLKARVKLASNANFATEVKPPGEMELTLYGARDLSMGNEPQNEKNSRCRLADSKNERIGFGLPNFIPDSTQLGAILTVGAKPTGWGSGDAKFSAQLAAALLYCAIIAPIKWRNYRGRG